MIMVVLVFVWFSESSRAQAIWLPSLFGSFGVFVTAITAVFIK